MENKNKPLTIGLVVDDSLDKTDGVQQYVLTLGAWLTRQGHEVHYITSRTHRKDLENLHVLSRNIKVKFNGNYLHMPLPADPRAIKNMFKQVRFDVLHVQVPYSPLLASKVIKNAPDYTAVVGTFHIFPHSKMVSLGTRGLGIWLRRSLRRFDSMLAVSNAAQQFARQSFKVEATVIPNMVDVNRFTIKAPKRKPEVTVVFLGRLVARKGAMQLIRAVQYLREHTLTNKKFKVVLGGKGPLAEPIRQFVASNGLDDIVEMPGFVAEEDKAEFLARGDIAVFPSTGGESFGISLIEAMAATPGVVIAGDNAGYRSVLGEREKQLCNPYNTPQFAQLLAGYIDSAKLREEARIWQKQKVAQYDTPVVGAQIVTAYRRALRLRNK